MAAAAHPTRGRGALRTAVTLALFTLVGINLRSVILAVPPVLPQIKNDLGLSYTATGFLTSLPVLMMAAAAWPSGALAGRTGAKRSVGLGLALLAVGALLRAVWPTVVPLFLFTALLSLGIAVAQTAMPVLARQCFPARIGFVSALYSDGLILGEAIAAGVTKPFILGPLGADAWVATFVVWSLPVFATLALWLVLAPPAPPTATASGGIRLGGMFRRSGEASKSPSAGSDGKEGRRRVSALHLGILIGSVSLVFFGMNGWIATYNQALGRQAETALALAVLNAAQLPVSLAMTPFAQRLAGRRWPFIVAGIVCAVALAGWLLAPASLEPVWAALLGGSSAFVFVLGIALPPLLAGQSEVARLTGQTLMLSYGVAFLGPLLGGSLWDTFGLPWLAFMPVAGAAVLLVVLGSLLPTGSAFGLLPTERPTALQPDAAAPSRRA